jgi:four helix bundle protein
MNHEKTRLYQTSLELVAQCAQMAKRFPPGLGFLSDQLRRAAASVPLNFAEGCRRKSLKERARYFEIASTSAREVSAIIDVAFVSEGVAEDERAKAKDRCDHLCAMLHKFH